jgi:hypothetical protein
MLNPIKTPTQMMYEQANLPHYGTGGKTGVIEQFASRIQDAIRKYTKAVGKPPSPEEVKQLEDHIRSLSLPTGNAPQTMARTQQQTPFANQLVDQSGRPYPAVTTPEGRTIIVCPAQTREDITCATCGLCARADRRVIIGFRAHGSRARVTDALARRVIPILKG